MLFRSGALAGAGLAFRPFGFGGGFSVEEQRSEDRRCYHGGKHETRAIPQNQRKRGVAREPGSPFFLAWGAFRGGGAESESDLEPDWDSDPDTAGRGLSSSSESLPAPLRSDWEAESEPDVAFWGSEGGKKHVMRGKAGNVKRLRHPAFHGSRLKAVPPLPTFFFPLPPTFFPALPGAFFSGVKSCTGSHRGTQTHTHTHISH